MRRWASVIMAALTLFVCLSPALAQMGTVTASSLVVRAGPGQDYAVLGEAPQGAELTVLAYVDGWYAISYGDLYGYVHERYVRLSLPDVLAPTAYPAAYGLPVETAPPLSYETAKPNLTLPPLTFTEENNPNYPRVMKPGDTGSSVLDLQVTLQHLGYEVPVDGLYSYDTQAAVMKLQISLGIDPDGIVGALTRRMIGGGGAGDVEMLDWWRGGNVAYARLTEATVIDVLTGKRFKISRHGGDSHCDAEPLTAQDTQTFLTIAGGEWSWARRPVWLELDGRVIAASMNCMPHDDGHISDNGFDGHFCIHFLNSRTHDTDRIDEQHSACVLQAWNSRSSYSP